MVEIVIHAYGPFYICLLAEQLRSLANHPSATATVLYCADEGHILSVAVDDRPIGKRLWWILDKPRLLNRTIGRNLAAKRSKADWVWFADADYLFGDGSVEAVAKLDPHAACMYWPRTVLRPPEGDYYDDWPEGTDAAERCTVPSGVSKAIGGCQIVPGHLARTYGYLDGVQRHHGMAPGDVFLDTRGDQAYRGWLADKTGLPILPADIPNVCRLRHRLPSYNARHKLLPMVK